ncbi:RNA polymerase factor sigma-32 [Alkalilacustris brevis]|uniref:RNA polymerase factor sigma-32 n=1 Tax=Alkalilacustris brevis TaxID=2026338 RepID=UPI000E0CE6F0|nr:RNA polymerase factor sigma-32 [Alkalilacustris brevis]
MADQQGHTRRYVRDTMSREMLDAGTERDLALAWRDKGDEAALHRLVSAYARLAVSMAGRFRSYGVPYEDLVQQANLGLMRAAEKFDPDNGARFSTYARWWIKASMQEYAMRNISVVRTAAGAAQKKLFFNMRRVQAVLEREAAGRDEVLNRDALCLAVAEELSVPVADAELMLARLSGPDLSLNAPQSDAGESREWIDLLEDDTAPTEDVVLGRIEGARRRDVLADALMALPQRERHIVVERHLHDEPRTLNRLGEELGISKERVRQLEERALARMRETVLRAQSRAGAPHAA